MASVVETNPTDASVPQTVEKWAAIAGKWQFQGDGAKYLGPDDSRAGTPLGAALGSLRFRDGKISTIVKFGSSGDDFGAGILFGFQSLDAPYHFASIGSFDKAYSVGEFRPGRGWSSVSDAGLRSNLDASREHLLEAEVSGQTVRFTVDDVDVLNIVLPRPIEGTGCGLFAWGRNEVQFREMAVQRTVPKIFVIMPFAEPFDTLYHDVIQPVAATAGFEIVRVDEISGPGIILNDIQQQIEQSHAVVAEITTQNPNVFYELGYAHALHKPAILLVRREEGSKMPFDVRSYRAIFYDDSIGGKKLVERTLRQHLDAIRDNT